LLDLGFTHRRVVLLLHASSVLLAAAATGVTFGRSWQSGAALALAGGVLFTLVRAVGRRQPTVLQLVAAVDGVHVAQATTLAQRSGTYLARAVQPERASDTRAIELVCHACPPGQPCTCGRAVPAQDSDLAV
jgi:glutamine amidotransferase PdxT